MTRSKTHFFGIMDGYFSKSPPSHSSSVRLNSAIILLAYSGHHFKFHGLQALAMERQKLARSGCTGGSAG